MTFEEMMKQLDDLNVIMRDAKDTMQKAGARIIAMNTDWQEVLRLCKVENMSPADLERTIMQIGIIARKYYIP